MRKLFCIVGLALAFLGLGAAESQAARGGQALRVRGPRAVVRLRAPFVPTVRQNVLVIRQRGPRLLRLRQSVQQIQVIQSGCSDAGQLVELNGQLFRLRQ